MKTEEQSNKQNKHSPNTQKNNVIFILSYF